MVVEVGTSCIHEAWNYTRNYSVSQHQLDGDGDGVVVQV